MNTILTLLFTLLAVPSSFRMMVISDPHVLDSTLFDVNSASMQSEMQSRLNQNEYAQAAFIQLVDQTLKDQPDVVLIPGDMTMNGSRVSHQSVANQLQRLTTAGIKVCLIPGNHDINGTAYKYTGTEREKVPVVDDQEFDSIYAFLNTSWPSLRQDPNSHSYVVTLAPRLTLIGADCAADGAFTDATLKWICTQADSAIAMGDRVLAMMHYQLLEHTDEFGTLFPQALVDDYETIAQIFRAHGIELVLTGHMHINNATTNYIAGDSIVEITTGTPCMYTNSYRMIALSDNWSELQCETKYITSLPNTPAFSVDNNKNHVKYTLLNVKLPDLIEPYWEKRDTIHDLINEAIKDLPTLLSATVKGVKAVIDLDDAIDNILAQVPEDKDERTKYINSFIGDDAAQIAFIHIEGNEGEKDTQQLRENIFTDVSNCLKDLITKAYPVKDVFLLGDTNKGKRNALHNLVDEAAEYIKGLDKVKDFLDGFFGDYTHYKKAGQNRTDDLRPHLHFASLPQRDYYATVYYKLNGFGEDFVDSVLINEPTAIPQPQDPTYEGKAFGGWYTNPELTQAYDFSTIINAENDVTITLYAKWQTVLTFTLGDVKKPYDGTPVDILYKYKEQLPKSYTPYVEVDTILTHADSVIYHVTKTTILFNKEDVTNNYFITWTPDSARMVVTPRTILITTATDSMPYNGSPLTAQDTTMSGDGFVPGEGIDITYTGTQTAVGSSPNTITYTAQLGTLLSDYAISVTPGLLIVSESTQSTSLKESPNKEVMVEKIIFNHQLLIRKNGKLYNALGQEL